MVRITAATGSIVEGSRPQSLYSFDYNFYVVATLGKRKSKISFETLRTGD